MGCKGRIRMSANEETYNVVVNHNHPPSFGETKASTALADIALQAREEPNTNPLILTQNLLSQVDSETAVALPKEKSLKRKIQRIRRENQPALPKTLEDLGELPANYREINGVDWLLFDNREDNMENRVMLFAGEGVINAMSQSDLWFGDGTFQSVPRIFGQLYVVHYEVEGNVFPGCYALMRNRTGQSYDILFSAIRNLLPDARKDGPAKFSSDFELATTNSFLSVFPRASESYCFFHFAQSLWRRAQAFGIAQHYKREDEQELRSQFHACLALAFVPPEHVVDAFQDLREAADHRLDDLLDLLEDYYVLGRRRGRGRRTPRYPIQSWNVHQQTIDGMPRTNNSAEAWNRRWNIVIGKSHPNIFKMLESLKKEEIYFASQRNLVDLGNPPPAKKAKYIESDLRLRRIAERFPEIIEVDGDPDPWRNKYLRYLRTIGHSARTIYDQ